MQKKFLPLLLLPVLTLASCGGSSTPAQNVGSETRVSGQPSHGTKSAGDQTKSADELQVLNELNAARTVARDCGSKHMAAAAPVTWNGYLATAARNHAQDMATRNYFSHTTPDGKTITNRAEEAGYAGWTELGENIAGGFEASSVMKGWLDSPSHCETLMNPALKEVGIGYAYKSGTEYGSYWVQDFGTR